MKLWFLVALVFLSMPVTACRNMQGSLENRGYTQVSLLPPEGWEARDGVELKKDGRLYVTKDKTGSALKHCSFNLDEFPYLMIRMNDSLPGAVWTIFAQKDSRKFTLIETIEEGEFLIPLKKITGWTGRTDFTLGITLKGKENDWIVFDHINMVKFDDAVPEAPVLFAPANGINLRRYAVMFQWMQVPNAVSYELQYDTSGDFSNITQTSSVIINSPFVTENLWYLPERYFPEGRWFWRIRGLNMDNKPGEWSKTGEFEVSANSTIPAPERHISSENPLLILHCDGNSISANWHCLPEDIKQNTVLRVEVLPVENIDAACRTAQDNGIPILVQVSGPHDFYGKTSSRVSLSELERLYQHYPAVKGAFICEQACQYDGLKNPNVWKYMDRLIQLSASYGRLTIWADGHWGRHQWLDLASNETLLNTIKNCRDYFAPVWKMNCGVTPYSVHSALLGLWLSGSVNNWGVEPENWYWFEAGFAGQSEQKWFKEGDPGKMPPSFYGQMLLLGIMSGASVYVLEPPSAIWDKPGVLAGSWNNSIYPLVKNILQFNIVPSRETVWEQVKYAAAFDANIKWDSGYGTQLKDLYRQIYKPDSVFDVLPKTNNYFIPIFLPGTINGAYAELSGNFNTAKNGDRILFTKNSADEAAFSGTALIVRNKNVFFVMNNMENSPCVQNYSLKLTGKYGSVSGTLKTNEFLICNQYGPSRLRMIFITAQDADAPKFDVKLSPEIKALNPPQILLKKNTGYYEVIVIADMVSRD